MSLVVSWATIRSGALNTSAHRARSPRHVDSIALSKKRAPLALTTPCSLNDKKRAPLALSRWNGGSSDAQIVSLARVTAAFISAEIVGTSDGDPTRCTPSLPFPEGRAVRLMSQNEDPYDHSYARDGS